MNKQYLVMRSNYIIGIIHGLLYAFGAAEDIKISEVFYNCFIYL